MNTLRTLHLDTEKDWRGGEQQALYLMQGLLARDHGVTLICRRGQPFEQRAWQAGIPFRALRNYGLTVNAWRLARWLEKHPIDIIHAHTARAHSLGLMARGLCAAWACPPMVVSRRVDFSIHKLPLRLSGLKYRFGVDRYIAISECVRDVMVRDGIPAEKISVVYSSVDRARYDGVTPVALREELNLPPQCPLLVNVAMLVGHKGHTFLLQAMPLILERFPRARCVILGEGELREKLTSEAEALGIGDAVVFAGYRDDALRCIAAADVFVMTSHMEGLCTSILDALALNRPVVATRAGGIPEIITHERNGLLAESRNPESIAAQVCRMLSDADLRARCVEAGDDTLDEKFGVDGLVEGTLGVYRAVLARRAGESA